MSPTLSENKLLKTRITRIVFFPQDAKQWRTREKLRVMLRI